MTHSPHGSSLADLPEGARYLPDFISDNEATQLLSQVDHAEWDHCLKRRVQHYGYRYDYTARIARKEDYTGPIPAWFGPILMKIGAELGFNKPADQIIVNEYMPGQGIANHIDCVPCFGSTIASLSLGSGCEMKFSDTMTNQKLSKHLAPNSLLVLSGASRWQWKHGIPARKSDQILGPRVLRGRRISLTFRTMNFT